MSMPFIRYDTAPTLYIPQPQCNSCLVDVDSDGDGWTCPLCGTTWTYDDGEDTPGTPYPDWSGESVAHLPITAHEDGWKVRPPTTGTTR